MQVDNFTFDNRIPLPPTLRYVAVDNEAFELLRPVGDLLQACRCFPSVNGIYLWLLHDQEEAPLIQSLAHA